MALKQYRILKQSGIPEGYAAQTAAALAANPVSGPQSEITRQSILHGGLVVTSDGAAGRDHRGLGEIIEMHESEARKLVAIGLIEEIV